jgi:lipopolysaccharide export system permease protein
MAIFSVGYTPKKLLRYLLPTAFLFTLIITIIAIFVTPYATQKMKNYRNKKIYESKLKILPKKLSQTFGKHHVFIDENKNGEFKNVTMFTENEDGHVQILLAKKGFVKNDTNSSSYLNLDNGTLYRNKDIGFNIVNFNNMKIYNNAKYYSKRILPTKEYWLENKSKFYYYLLISLSPLFLVILYIAFGIYNPRYQKNKAALYIIVSVLLIYIPSIITRKLSNPYILVAVLIAWIVLSIIVFKKKVLKRY